MSFTTIGTINSLITVVSNSKPKPYEPPVLPSPSAWYKFNINTDICGNRDWLYYNYANGLYDASLNSYSTFFPTAGNCFLYTPSPPSTYISPTVYYTNGLGGTSGNFSNICIQNKIYTPSTGFTICFWYNTTTINGNGHQVLNLTGGTSGSNQFGIFCQTSNWVFQMAGTTYTVASFGSYNVWSHNAFVLTQTADLNTLLRYYKNSVLTATITIPRAFPANSTFSNSQLGINRTAANYTSDFRFFPNVLSQNDIYSIYIFRN